MLPIDQDSNPMCWWREHCLEYPLLSLYVKANFSFQPTSVASESVFNDDKEVNFFNINLVAPETCLFQVYDDRRKRILTGRGEGLVIAQNFIKKRANEEEFRLCKQCPAPQNSDGECKYKIMCPKHQKV